MAIAIGDDDHAFAVAAAGEVQSTVIPPGDVAPAGRILVSVDWSRPPLAGTNLGLVLGRDLDRPDGPDIRATFGAPPAGGGPYWFGTNDHDLLLHPNGDVLYCTGAFTAAPLNPKPGWFDLTYRGSFGPGARTNLMVWSSRDGGQTFDYHGEMDPALMDDGAAANPQGAKLPQPDGTYRYDMGGSDGQVTVVDRQSGDLYLVFQIVGQMEDAAQTSATGTYVLSSTPVNRTLLARSRDLGRSWEFAGYVDLKAWRFGALTLPDGRLALSFNDAVVYADPDPSGQFQASVAAISGGWNYEYPGSFQANAAIKATRSTYLWANVAAHPVIARCPGREGCLIAFPTLVERDGKSAFGYGVKIFDHENQQILDGEPVLPSATDGNGFIMHLTLIDLGDGPALMYWYDVDATNNAFVIRGRLVRSPEYMSADFPVSRSGGHERVVDMTRGGISPTDRQWYGDYHTAGGFLDQEGNAHFYPVWVEPDGVGQTPTTRIVFNEVVVSARGELDDSRTPAGIMGSLREVPGEIWVHRFIHPLDIVSQHVRPLELLRRGDGVIRLTREYERPKERLGGPPGSLRPDGRAR